MDYGELRELVRKLLAEEKSGQGIFYVIDECNKRFQGDYLTKKLVFICLAAIMAEQQNMLDERIMEKIVRFSDELKSGKYRMLFDEQEEKLIWKDLKLIKRATMVWG